MNRQKTNRLLIRLTLALTLAPFGPQAAVYAQGAAYCNVTGITTRRLSNAVLITVKADGVMNLDWDIGNFFNMEALQKGRFEDAGKTVTELPLRITNARSKVVPLTDIGVYPASHVELQSPAGAPEGIGLDLKLVLFAPATVTKINFGFDMDLPVDDVKGPKVTIQLTQDQSSLVFLISGDRRIPPPFELRKAPPNGPVELQVSCSEGLVSIDALNARLSDVLAEVARKSGRQLLMDGTIDHVASLHLHDVNVEDAVRSLAAAYSLTASTDEKVIRVTETSGRTIPAYERNAVYTIPCRNTTALSVRDSLPEFLLKHIRVNIQQNTLEVIGSSDLAARIRSDVEVLDRPVPLIEVTATVVECASTSDLDAALGLGVRSGDDFLSLSSITGDITFRSVGPLPDAFETSLHAMQASGKGRVVSRPRATAGLGQTAKLFVGRQQYVTVLEYDMFQDAWVSDILNVDVGTRLEIKPLMIGEDGITLVVTPAVSSVSEIEPRTGMPTVFSRSLSSTVRIKNGDTIVVGGLGMNQDSRGSRRIPILSDLPFIGSLFRSPRRTKSPSELAFLVQARLVEKSAPAADTLPGSPRRSVP